MQHKRKYSIIGITISVLLGVIAACIVLLMSKDIKPAQQVVEKQLDAGTFLNNK